MKTVAVLVIVGLPVGLWVAGLSLALWVTR